MLQKRWTPVFTGVTTFGESVTFNGCENWRYIYINISDRNMMCAVSDGELPIQVPFRYVQRFSNATTTHASARTFFGVIVKSRKFPATVIPAKAGIQTFPSVTKNWIPVFTGMTTFDEAVFFNPNHNCGTKEHYYLTPDST
ncbi:MAG: hypothetical protein ACOYOS_08240 [Syntrophales bacterium]